MFQLQNSIFLTSSPLDAPPQKQHFKNNTIHKITYKEKEHIIKKENGKQKQQISKNNRFQKTTDFKKQQISKLDSMDWNEKSSKNL